MEKVIYTVLTGAYDRLQQPEAISPGWKYVCYTDAPAGQDGVWELRPIPFEGTPLERARWVKLHPHILLPEAGLSVFMDANLCITGEAFYGPMERPAQTLVAGLPHLRRDCVYEELRYCYLKDKLGTRAFIRHGRRLREMGMPRHAGLYETNILWRRHLDPAVVALDEAWWDLMLSSCMRDQLSFTPALRTCHLEPELLFGPGNNARNVPFVRYSVHPATGRENVPGKLNWANVKYRLRLWWRQLVLLCRR